MLLQEEYLLYYTAIFSRRIKRFVWGKNKIGGKALQELDKTLKETEILEYNYTNKNTTEAQTDKILGTGKPKKEIKVKKSDYTIGTKVSDRQSSFQKIKTSFFNSNIMKKITLEFLDNNAGLRYLEDAVKKII